MLVLAWANLTHRKVRTTLSVLAVAIAITLLLVLVGLSNGTLNEVSRRMESVEAEIVVRDRHFDLGSMSGGKLWEKETAKLMALQIADQPAIARVIPVFLGRMKLGGLSQNVFGVAPGDFPTFAGSRKLLAGELFRDLPEPITNGETLQALPLVIDERLSKAAHMNVGDHTDFAGQTSQIVGIVETGVAGRVFAPINMLRSINGVGARTAHMFFVKAQPGFNNSQLQQLCDLIGQTTQRDASLVADYGHVLADNFKNLTIFITLVSIIALVICFLFILVTMYTIVLERGKEIAILQSLGAGRQRILRQTLQEAFLICATGTLAGILLAYGVRLLIETVQPLMTIEMKLHWLVIAAVIGIGGGLLSTLYPSYLALRHDPVEVLSFE